MLEKFSLDGRVAVVTGGGGGLGSAIAVAFAQAGAKIVITDFRPDDGERAVTRVREAGGKATFFPADITKSEEVNSMMAKAVAEWGRVDILLNGAGIVREQSRRGDSIQKEFWEITDRDWHLGIDTNLTGAFYSSRAIMKHMADRGSGRVISIASGFGMRGLRGGYMYCSAKAGVIGLTMSLALSVARYGIRVNAIAPGLYRTFDAKDSYDVAANYIPAGRVGEAREITALAVFLASDASDYANGEVFTTDGGALADGAAPTGFAPVIPLK